MAVRKYDDLLLVPPTIGGDEDSEEARAFEQRLREQLAAETPAPAVPSSLPVNPLMQQPAPTAAPEPQQDAPTLPIPVPMPAAAEPAPAPAAQPGPLDHSSREGFIRSLRPYAEDVAARRGIPADLLMAIPLNEQGWQYEAPGFNLYGIKGRNPRTGANTGPVSTWEDYGQGRVNIQDTFRSYSSPAESMEDFADFLRDNSRYANALKVLNETGDGAAFLREVHRAGYATDPRWSDKVLSIANDVRRVVSDPNAPPPVPYPQRAPYSTLAEEMAAGQQAGVVPQALPGNPLLGTGIDMAQMALDRAMQGAAGISAGMEAAERWLGETPLGQVWQAVSEPIAGEATRLAYQEGADALRYAPPSMPNVDAVRGELGRRAEMTPQRVYDEAPLPVFTGLIQDLPLMAYGPEDALFGLTARGARGMGRLASRAMPGAVDPATGRRYASVGAGRVGGQTPGGKGDLRSTYEVKQPFIQEVNERIANHPDFPALKKTVDAALGRLYGSRHPDTAQRITGMMNDLEGYLAYTEMNAKSPLSKRLDALQKKIMNDIGLPLETGRTFRGNTVDWRAYEAQQTPTPPAATAPEPTAAPAGSGGAKQPWEMTLDEQELAGVRPWQRTFEQWIQDINVERANRAAEREPKYRAAGATWPPLQGMPTVPVTANELPLHRHDHRALVDLALSEGKPVPPEVLADYPDLAAQYGRGAAPDAPVDPLAEAAPLPPATGPGDVTVRRGDMVTHPTLDGGKPVEVVKDTDRATVTVRLSTGKEVQVGRKTVTKVDAAAVEPPPVDTPLAGADAASDVPGAAAGIQSEGVALRERGRAARVPGTLATGSSHIQDELIGEALERFGAKVNAGADPRVAVEEEIAWLHERIGAENTALKATMRMYVGVGDERLWDAYRRIRDTRGLTGATPTLDALPPAAADDMVPPAEPPVETPPPVEPPVIPPAGRGAAPDVAAAAPEGEAIQYGHARTIEANQQNEAVVKEIEADLQKMTYAPRRSTAELYARGKARVDADPDGEFAALLRSNDHTDEDVAAGLVLERRLLSEGRREQATELISHMAETGLQAGRLVQAYTLWNRLSPEGMLLSVARTFKRLSKGAADKGATTARRFKENLEDVAEKAVRTRTGKQIVEAKENVTRLKEELADTVEQVKTAGKGTETNASRKARGLLKKVVYYLENEARAPFAPNSPEANALNRMKRLAQETGWNLDHAIAREMYGEMERIKALPKAEREPAIQRMTQRFVDDYLPMLEERSATFRQSQDLIDRTRKAVFRTTDRGRLPMQVAPRGSEERQILSELQKLTDKLGYRLPDELATILNDALDAVEGLDVGNPARLAEAKRIIREDIGQRVVGPLREMNATATASNQLITQAGKTVTFLADQGRNPKLLNLTDEETQALATMRRNANLIGYLLPPERAEELAGWLDAIKQYRPGSQERTDAVREYIKRLTTGDIAKEIDEGVAAFKAAKKEERRQRYIDRGGFYSDEARAKWEEANLKYLIDEAERIVQPRLVFAEKQAVAAVRKAVREGSGTELPPEFAELLQDRAKALGVMPETTGTEKAAKWQATQEFMNLTRMLVPPSAWKPLFDVLNVIPRVAITMWDFSAGGLQAGFLALSNPREWGRAMRTAFDALKDGNVAAEVNARLRTRPGAARADKANLYMADAGGSSTLNTQEEQLLGRVLGEGVQWKVPGGGREVMGREVPRTVQVIGGGPKTGKRRLLSADAYGDAYVTFLNKFRADIFDKLADTAEGLGIADDKVLADLAGLVNAGTGRGGHGLLDRYNGLSSKVLFAPSYFASLVETPVQAGRAVVSSMPGARRLLGDKAYHPFVAQQVGKAWAGFLVLGGTQMLLGRLMGGEVELDPRSNNFGDIQIGPVRFNAFGGHGRLASVLTQLATGQSKSSSGNIVPADSNEIIGTFSRGKLAPVVGIVNTLRLDSDFVGRPALGKAARDSLIGNIEEITKIPLRGALGEAGGAVNLAVSSLMPLTVQSFLRSSALVGLGGGALATMPAVLGRPMNAYENQGDMQDRVSREMFGVDFNAKDAQGVPLLDDTQKQQVRQHQDVQERQAERPDRVDYRQAVAQAAEAGKTRLKAQMDLDARVLSGAIDRKAWRERRRTINDQYAGAIQNSRVKELPLREADPSNRAEVLAQMYYSIPTPVDATTGEEDFGTFFKLRDLMVKRLTPEDKATLDRYLDQHDTPLEREYRWDMEQIRQYWDHIDTLKAEPRIAAAIQQAQGHQREARTTGDERTRRMKEEQARVTMSVVNKLLTPQKNLWRMRNPVADALLKKWGYTSVLIMERAS